MSNYTPPYPSYPQPPQGQQPYNPGYYGAYPQDPFAPLRGACKRAGILQIVLASLSLLCGSCAAAMSPFMTLEMFAQAQMQIPPGLNLELLRRIYLIAGLIVAVIGLVMVVLGAFVVRGSRGAVIASIVVSILAALLQLIGVVASFAKGNPLEGALNFLILGLVVWLLWWLFQAASAAGQLAGYAQAGYGTYPQAQAGYGQSQPYGSYPPYQQQQQWPGQQQQQQPPQPQWPPQPQQQQQQWPPPPQPPPSS